MIKIKVIDLLVKIANGEIEENIKYKFSQSDYCSVREFFNRYIMDRENLNIKVETNDDKKIEKLEMMNSRDYLEDTSGNLPIKEIALDIETLRHWINKIIDKINKE